MNREEAIRVLEDNRPSVIFEDEASQKRMAELCQAIDIAIEALQADAVCEDTQTEERARFVAKETELAHIEAKLENAEKRLQGACTANFVAEQLDRLRNMTYEERWDFFIKFFSPSADTVSREFYEDAVKANIGLVKENKELKEQIESAEAVKGEEYREVKEEYINTVGAILAVISAPSCLKEVNDLIEPLRVVRCKDCRYGEHIQIHLWGNREIDNAPSSFHDFIKCHKYNIKGFNETLYLNDDDFCSYGERREE